jgi:hypothetical protein
VAIEFYQAREYLAARGPTFVEGAPSPRYKLCVVATDLDYLVEFLRAAVSRPDGYYVKYSEQPVDGMYLGRVFLNTDEALARLWVELKSDPKLLASIQDDELVRPFRSVDSGTKAAPDEDVGS